MFEQTPPLNISRRKNDNKKYNYKLCLREACLNTL